jgi:hypothetical protein
LRPVARNQAIAAGPQTGRDKEPIDVQTGDLNNLAAGPEISLGPATSLDRARPAIAICASAIENSYKTFPAAFAIATNGRSGDSLNATTSETLCAKMQATIGMATNGG